MVTLSKNMRNFETNLFTKGKHLFHLPLIDQGTSWDEIKAWQTRIESLSSYKRL